MWRCLVPAVRPIIGTAAGSIMLTCVCWPAVGVALPTSPPTPAPWHVRAVDVDGDEVPAASRSGLTVAVAVAERWPWLIAGSAEIIRRSLPRRRKAPTGIWNGRLSRRRHIRPGGISPRRRADTQEFVPPVP